MGGGIQLLGAADPLRAARLVLPSLWFHLAQVGFPG